MNIDTIAQYCQNTVTQLQKEWPLVAKVSIIGVVVHKALGGYATAVYAATAIVLHHKHPYIINEISKISCGDLVVGVMTCIAPFFGLYGAGVMGVVAIAHTINKNIQLYRISGQYQQTLQQLVAVEEKQKEINRNFNQVVADCEEKNKQYTERLEGIKQKEQECRQLMDQASKIFTEICNCSQIASIRETLASNQRVWQALLARCSR